MLLRRLQFSGLHARLGDGPGACAAFPTLRLLVIATVLAMLSPIAGAEDHLVTALSNPLRFEPRTLTIAAGDTVTFQNGDGHHNVVSDPGSVPSFRCANGCDGAGGDGTVSSAAWTATVAFPSAGVVRYFCEAHGATGGVGMSGTVTVTGPPPFELSAGDQYLWMVPPASNTQQQGFLRLINRENVAGGVTVWGLDAAGQRSPGTISLTLAPRESRQFNSQDLEGGNPSKGLESSLGDGAGNWTVIVRSSLDIDVLAYIRTPDGFLTSMHDRVVGNGVDWLVPIFNPAENQNQVSRLRVINSNSAPVGVLIAGRDDAGIPGLSQVALDIPPLATVEISSTDLENGNAGLGLSGSLGNGTGKWNLLVSATRRVTVQSLLFDPRGYLTNLSTLSDLGTSPGGERTLWLVPPASNAAQQGFVRLINRENRAGAMAVWGIDDAGMRSSGTMTLTLAAKESRQFNSQDMELGNLAKGLSGSLGSGTGNWRLVLSSDLDYLPMALIRTPDGFLTTIHDRVAGNGLSLEVPIFNPAENLNQASVLRLINPGASTASVTITGRDDGGVPAPGGVVSLSLGAGTAMELSAVDLENGNPAKGLSGNLGNGTGKWELSLAASSPIVAMSLLRDPQGYLTNLSNITKGTSSKLDP